MAGPVPEFKQAISDDPEVRLAAKKLALSVIAEARDILEYGTPANRISIVRALLPAISNSLKEKEQDDAMVQLRSEFESLAQQITG